MYPFTTLTSSLLDLRKNSQGPSRWLVDTFWGLSYGCFIFSPKKLTALTSTEITKYHNILNCFISPIFSQIGQMKTAHCHRLGPPQQPLGGTIGCPLLLSPLSKNSQTTDQLRSTDQCGLWLDGKSWKIPLVLADKGTTQTSTYDMFVQNCFVCCWIMDIFWPGRQMPKFWEMNSLQQRAHLRLLEIMENNESNMHANLKSW